MMDYGMVTKSKDERKDIVEEQLILHGIACLVRLVTQKNTRRIVEVLDRSGSLRSRELFEILKKPAKVSIPISTFDYNMAELVENKIVDRKVDEQDRSVSYSISERGKLLFDSITDLVEHEKSRTRQSITRRKIASMKARRSSKKRMIVSVSMKNRG
jgi:DNA-binding HxlR family transcriptional regulator